MNDKLISAIAGESKRALSAAERMTALAPALG